MKFSKKIIKLLSFDFKPENSGLVSGIFTVVISLVAFGATFSHSASSLKSIIGPVTIPRLVAGIIFVLGLAQLIRHYSKRKNAPVASAEASEEKNAEAEEEPIDKMQVYKVITPWVSFALIAMYIALMKPIGFVLASTLYLTLQIPLLSVDLSKRSFLKAFVIGIITAVVVFLIFAEGFGLRLPTNDWGF